MTKKVPIVHNSKSFLVCFSEAEDLLSQWQAYGNDRKGIAIGFNSNWLESFTDVSMLILSIWQEGPIYKHDAFVKSKNGGYFIKYNQIILMKVMV